MRAVVLTADDILTSSGEHADRMQLFPLADGWRSNATILASRVNGMLKAFGQSRSVVSGYRDPVSNHDAGGAGHSAHLICEAADLYDADGSLAEWLVTHHDQLVTHDLWMESPKYTQPKGKRWWVHVQTRPAPSGRRIFNP